MKIDIHVHTKKIKSGDSASRNIESQKFSEIIKATDVKILAITNHNHFDLDQYIQFQQAVETSCQIWPGVELDILENGRRAHLIVIVNPIHSVQFNKTVAAIIEGKSPDLFTIGLKETVAAFDKLDAVYITHYYAKKPNLEDEEVELLTSLVQNEKRILKEATNAISVGIYISHGHRSIYGSDVQNWGDYITLSKSLPDLRLPVESFEQFCLLLDKDDSTIDTILDKKSKESIDIYPFGVGEPMTIDLYNDINIIFGSKGTGKTEILKAISNYYNNIGYKTEVYESNKENLDDAYDLRGLNLNVNISNHGIDDCGDEFELLKNATDKSVTSINNYVRFFSAAETNKIAQSLKIRDTIKQDDSASKRRFDDLLKIAKKVADFENYYSSSSALKGVIGDELSEQLASILTKILHKIKSEHDIRLSDFKALILVNQIIDVFSSEISKKTGQPKKPGRTGFKEYASNRISIERSVKKITSNLYKKIEPMNSSIGDLGEKGNLSCQTNLTIQVGNFSNSDYSPIRKVNKSAQKEAAKLLKNIDKYVYSIELFERISELNDVDGIETINSISDLVLFNRHFVLNGKPYRPSNGESSMVLLYKELKHDKEIYLIDEPEKSLGNDYISDIIVPLIKEKAQLGKKVIIATHDANIAVRTLPYCSIFRRHDVGKFRTYVGNPFSNNLKCITGDSADLNWKEVSMKTLEGGEAAFGERRKIYGNI